MTPRIMPLSLTLALTLAIASPASSKQVSSVEACGASGCADVTSSGHDWSAFNFGSTTTTPPRDVAFYRVTLGVGGHDHWAFLFVPAARKVQLPDDPPGTFRWLQVTDVTAQRLQKLIGGVKPYPADRLAATVDASVPRAQVVETYEPASANARADAGGGFDARPLAAGVLVLAIALGCIGVARRGRSRSSAGNTA